MTDTIHSDFEHVVAGSAAITGINDTLEDVDAVANALLVTAMADADVSLTTTDSDGHAIGLRSFTFEFTGANTAVRTVTFPDREIRKRIYNNTTGSFDITIRAATLGTTVAVPSGEFRDIQIVQNGSPWDVKNYSTGTGSGSGSGAANKFINSLGGGQREWIAEYDLNGIGTGGLEISDSAAFASDVEAVVFVFQGLVPDTNDTDLRAEISVASSFRNTGYVGGISYDSSVTDGGLNSISTYVPTVWEMGNATNEMGAAYAELRIFDPGNTSYFKHIEGFNTSRHQSSVFMRQRFYSSWEGGSGAIDGIKFFTDANTITSGKVTVFKESISKGADISTGGVWQRVGQVSATDGDEYLEIDASTLSDFDPSSPETEWMFEWENGSANTTETFAVQIGTGASPPTYQTSGNYDWATIGRTSTNQAIANGSTTATFMRVSGANNLSGHGTGTITVKDLEKSDRYKLFRTVGHAEQGTYISVTTATGYWNNDQNPITGIRFLLENSATINSLTVVVYRRSLRSPTVLPVGGAVSVVQVEKVIAQSTVDFTREIDDNGDVYEIFMHGTVSGSCEVGLQLGTGAGPTWATGASDYSRAYNRTAFANAQAFNGDTTDDMIHFTQWVSGEDATQFFRVMFPALSGRTFVWAGQVTETNAVYGGGMRNADEINTGIRINIDSGQTFTGTVTLIKYWNHERRGESNPAVMSNGNSTAKIWTKQDGTTEFYNHGTVANTSVGKIDASGRLLWGHDTAEVLDGNTPHFQYHGTSGDTARMGLARWSTNASASAIALAKSRGASIGTNGILATNDLLGVINFLGDDGTNLDTIGASIIAQIDGTPASNRMPTELRFSTAEGAGDDDLSVKMWLKPTGRVYIGEDGLEKTTNLNIVGNGRAIVMGSNITDATNKDSRIANYHYTNTEEPICMIMGNATSGTNQVNIGGGTSLLNAATAVAFFTAANDTTTSGTEAARFDNSGFFLHGHTAALNVGGLGAAIRSYAAGSAAGYAAAAFSADAVGPAITVGKSRNATIGSFTLPIDNDYLGHLNFVGSDAVNFSTYGAQISGRIDGTPAANRMPTEIEFRTAEGVADDDIQLNMVLKKDGTLEVIQGTKDNGFFNFNATIDADATSAISSLTTSGSVSHHIQIELNGTTAWIPVSTTDPS